MTAGNSKPLTDGASAVLLASEEWAAERGLPVFFFSSRRRHTRYWRDWSSDVCSSDLVVVESAEAIPLDPSRLDVRAASSRGLGELIARVGSAPRLLVCLGGTATMDGGSGLLDVLDELPAPTVALCDVRATLAEAPRLFGPQKGALADD